MTALLRYDAARHALAEAHRVDEVKDIRDKALAMQIYAQQAKDRDLIEHATEIRKRAEIRAGELLAEMEKHNGGRPPKTSSAALPVSTLADLGVTKTQSSRWQQMAALAPEEQEALIERAKKTAVAAVESLSEREKAERRAARETELAAKHLTLPNQPYGVIYADPPWRFEPYSRDTGMDRAADNHYPTMTLDEIKALAVPAADDAVLFLWATVPMLLQALDVMAAWKFSYRSHFIWDKVAVGTGYWVRNQHEPLLIGVRGNVPAPEAAKRYPSIIRAARGAHSAKPFCFREMIEDMFPRLRRTELFARERFSGWDCFGNEVPSAEAAE